jgi:hypothetical protein
MIRLGLRLTISGGREAVGRLALIAVAVAIGVALLLTTMAGINAVRTQNRRFAWLETGFVPVQPSQFANGAPVDLLWWQLRGDYFQGKEIARVDLAATGPHSPIPPGIPRLPGPGQYYASPAMAKLLRSTPAAELGDRIRGTQIGTIADEALASPDSLAIVVGQTADWMSQQGHARQVASISRTPPSQCGAQCAAGVGIRAKGIDLVLSVVAAALLFPLLIFVGSATRLSAARREQRFAAMRLVGATPRQISIISAVEAGVAAVAGVVLGFGLFFALRPTFAQLPFTGARFFLSDLALNTGDIAAVVIGIPVAAVIAARLALRRVEISPLGVTRHVTPKPPRAWRVIPLLAGIAELAYFEVAGRPSTTNGQIWGFLSGVLLVMFGLVHAGPWLTLVGARAMARRTSRPATLIAGRRLADDPKAGFRAISGLVVALFVGTVAVGVITTRVAYDGGSAGGPLAHSVLLDQFFVVPSSSDAAHVADATVRRVASIRGVTGVARVHMQLQPTPADGPPSPTGIVACTELASTPALGKCQPGAAAARVSAFLDGTSSDRNAQARTVWPAATISAEELTLLPVTNVIVATDGSQAAVERARTVLETAVPQPFPPQTLSEQSNIRRRQTRQYQQLADVVIIASLALAGCSIAVSVAGGLTDRRRPFSLLRLTGVSLGTLRQVVGIEGALPLLLSSVLASAVGVISAGLFVSAQMGEHLQLPGASYYLVVLAGLVAAGAVVASTLPLLRRVSGPETARND